MLKNLLRNTVKASIRLLKGMMTLNLKIRGVIRRQLNNSDFGITFNYMLCQNEEVKPHS
jgi:hypothetical protein